MAAIFISHSSEDNAQALALKEMLTKIGFDQVFLDFDKHEGIPLGSDWEPKLYFELERCHAVLLVLTKNWLASKWCFAEFAQARAMGKTIYVILEKPAGEPGQIASDIQVCDLVTNRESGLERLHRELENALLVAQAGFAFDERTRAPYPGLNAFVEADAAVFFGRDPEISTILEHMKSERARTKKALVLMGGSGTGKSSLMRAGALPRLRRERDVGGRPTHLVALMRPGEAPLRAACEALRAFDPTLMLADLVAVASPDAAWALIDQLRMKAGAPQAQLVLAVDQAEEIFAAPPQERSPFLGLLAELVAGGNPARLIFSMRADHVEAVQKTGLVDALEVYAVKPMPLDRLGEIVRGPAKRVDVSVEDELIEAIRADAATEDALPLVAFVLRELYERYGRKSRRLERAHYEAMRLGELTPLESAVRRRAEEMIAGAGEAELSALRRAFTPGLVRLDEERGTFGRRDARLDDLPVEARGLVAKLVDTRLLVTRAEADGVHVEVAHEALFRVWPKLAEWLAADRELLVRLQGVRRAALEWVGHGRDEAWLAHRGLRLEEAEATRENIAARFDDLERAYLAACRMREDAETEAAEQRSREREEELARRARDAEALAEANKRTTRRTRLGLLAALALFLVAMAVGVVAWQQKLRADDRAAAALTAQQAAERASAEEKRQRDVAEASKKEALAEKNAADLASAEAKTQRDRAAAALTDAKKQLLKAKISDSILRAKSASIDTDAKQYRTAINELSPVIPVNFDQIEAPATIEALEQLEVITANDRLESVFNVEKQVEWHDNNNWGEATISPTGDVIAYSTRYKGVRIYQVSTGVELMRSDPVGNSDEGEDIVRFSERGDRFFIAGRNGIVDIYQTRGLELISRLRRFGDILDAQFALNDSGIVTIGRDCFVRVRKLIDEEQVAVYGDGIPANVGWCRAGLPVFSRNKHYLAAPISRGSIGVWDLKSLRQAELVATGNDDKLLALSNNGDRLITKSSDKTASLYNTKAGNIITTWSSDNETDFFSVFSPDGSYIISEKSPGDGIYVIDTKSGRGGTVFTDKIGRLMVNLPKATQIAFDFEGRRVALLEKTENKNVGSTSVISIWDLNSGAMLLKIVDDLGLPSKLQFDPTGKKLLVEEIMSEKYNDTTVYTDDAVIWNVDTQGGESVLKETADYGGPLTLGDWAMSISGDSLAVVPEYGDGGSPNVALFDTRSGMEVAKLADSGGCSSSRLAIDPSGRRIVAISTCIDKDSARLYDATNGNELATLKHEGIFKAAFNSSGDRIVTGSSDGTAKIWDATNYQEIALLRGHSATVNSAAFSLTGDTVITASEDGTAQIWDARTGRRLHVLVGSGGQVNCGAISPDGKRAVTGGDDKSVRVWDIETETQIAELKGHAAAIGSVAFDASGERILSWATDGVARLWDAHSGNTIHLFPSAGDAHFTRPGDRIVTVRLFYADYSMAASMWDANTGNLIASRQSYLSREFVLPSLNGEGFYSIHNSKVTSLSLGAPLGVASLTETAIGDIEPNRVFRKQVSDANGPVSTEPCDELASSPYDPLRVANGVLFERLDKVAAESACRRAVEKFPNAPRFHFELARVLAAMAESALSYEQVNMKPEGSRSSRELGDQANAEYKFAEKHGYPAAIYNLAVAEERSPSNIDDVISRLKIALEGGLSLAGSALAGIYISGSGGIEPNLNLAIQYAQRGASLGDPNCHRLLAQFYEIGNGLPVDLKESVVHHALSSILFRDAGDQREASYDAFRRSTLARHLPYEVVYAARVEVEAWRASDKW